MGALCVFARRDGRGPQVQHRKDLSLPKNVPMRIPAGFAFLSKIIS